VGKLREALADLFPADSFLPGLGIGKGERVFSIRLRRQEEAVGIKLDDVCEWPLGRKRCDGLFVGVLSPAERFLVILVELKGNHVARAIEQIKETALILCKQPDDMFGVHSKWQTIAGFRRLLGPGHSAHVIGFVIATRALNLKQVERVILRRDYGLTVKFARKAEGMALRDMTSS